ncbi:hypothetical protein ACS0TY_019424 [Phlomoides rotata]
MPLETLPAMVAGIWSNEGDLQFEATTHFCKLLSIEVIQSGVVPRFVEFLTREDFLQRQTLPAMVAGIWSNEGDLRNPHIEEVIQSGVVPRFVEFLTREDFLQRELEAAWALPLVHRRTPRWLLIMEQSQFVQSFWVHQVMMFASRLSRHWEMLPVILLNAMTLSYLMGR